MPPSARTISPQILPRLRFVPRVAIRRPYAVALVVVLAALAAPFVLRTKSEWDIVYLPTAAHLVAGEDIYEQSHGYTYPPLQSLLAVPVLNQPKHVQRGAWFVVSALGLVVMLRSAWRLSGGGELPVGRRHREHVVGWLGLFAGGCYAFNSLSHQQTDLVLGAFVLGGCLLLHREKWFAAATAFGLAAAMKCTPLLFAAYLVVRGRFLAAAWLVLVAGAASLLPDVVHSPSSGTWLGVWVEKYLEPMAKPDYTPGVWASEIVYNQSVVGAANRWTQTTWTKAGNVVTVVPIPPRVDADTLKLAILGVALACALLAAMAMIVARVRGVSATPWECSLVLCGMLLFSPMSSAAHFGVLLLPGFLLARAAIVERRWWAWLPLAGVLGAAVFSNKDLVGPAAYTAGLWYGSAMAAAVAALVGSVAGVVANRYATDSTPEADR